MEYAEAQLGVIEDVAKVVDAVVVDRNVADVQFNYPGRRKRLEQLRQAVVGSSNLLNRQHFDAVLPLDEANDLSQRGVRQVRIAVQVQPLEGKVRV